jgi:hypothetical protein
VKLRIQGFVWALVALAAGVPVAAQESEHHHGDAAAEKLGNVHFPTSCRAEVGGDFERAVALLHSFAYPVAASAFESIAARDPRCGMARWGEAMSQYHQIWAPPTEREFATGAAAAREAARVGAGSERERAYIRAIGAFYLESAPRSHLERVRAYERQMAELATRFPDDDEAAIFHALAQLSVAYNSPPDKTYTLQKQAAATLNRVLPRQPEHPGVAHYMIHSFDYPGLAPLALDAARAYAKIAPSAPHALHMPSHIFTRLGLWQDSIESNLASSAAARTLVARLHPGATSYDDLHALDYLAYAYLQRGEDEKAHAVAIAVAAATRFDAFELAGAYALAAVPARYALERHAWREAAALKPSPESFPWAQFPHVEAIVHFARAVAGARSRDLATARAACARLAEIEAGLAAGYTKGFDWPTQVQIQRRAAEGWLRLAEGDAGEAERLLRAAADLEDRTDKHPVTPGAILPAREQLADFLLERGSPRAAFEEYEASLRNAPARYASIAGALAAAQAMGDSQRAAAYAAKLLALVDPGSQRPEIGRARQLVARQ